MKRFFLMCVAVFSVLAVCLFFSDTSQGRVKEDEAMPAKEAPAKAKPKSKPKPEKKAKSGSSSPSTKASARAAKSFTNSLGMTFVYCPPGTFMMGSPEYEHGRKADETQHQVTLTKGFYMQTTEVTQGQWRAVMYNNPSHFKDCGDKCPVEQVSWDDCQEFIRNLNSRDLGKGYRLPTEAEWEYACRAGSTTAYYFGDSDGSLGDYAWYASNSGGIEHPVAQKQPNAWGLYDMHGNVWEWCADWYENEYYANSPNTDPVGLDSGSYRVSRGGLWSDDARACRSANRGADPPGRRDIDIGLRVVASRVN